MIKPPYPAIWSELQTVNSPEYKFVSKVAYDRLSAYCDYLMDPDSKKDAEKQTKLPKK